MTMDQMTKHDPDAGFEPAFAAPPNACDSHFHVFGPAGRYPHNQADLRYAPPVAPVGDFLALARKLGIERFVFVQPSAYGRDNRCMLDAMREVGTNCRGIVDIDENEPDAELERLHSLGVHGVRVTFGDMYLFQHWKLTDEPTLTLGMDLLGSFDVLVIDYNRHELQIRLRGSKLPD